MHYIYSLKFEMWWTNLNKREIKCTFRLYQFDVCDFTYSQPSIRLHLNVDFRFNYFLIIFQHVQSSMFDTCMPVVAKVETQWSTLAISYLYIFGFIALSIFNSYSTEWQSDIWIFYIIFEKLINYMIEIYSLMWFLSCNISRCLPHFVCAIANHPVAFSLSVSYCSIENVHISRASWNLFLLHAR